MNFDIKPKDAAMLALLIVMVLVLAFAGMSQSDQRAMDQNIEQLESR